MRPAPFTAADLLDTGQYDASRATELRGQPRRSGFSRRCIVPLEKPDHPCGTVVLLRLDGGRLLARRVDCRTKACRRCGPRLRAQAARTWAAVMAGAGVSRLVVSDADWPRFQRKLRKAGADYGVIPAAGAGRVVYTTADLGTLVDDLAGQLAADFAAMPSDRRHKRLSTSWRQLAAELAHTGQAASSREVLGILGRPLEQLAVIADGLGMLLGQAAGALVLRDPPDVETWRRFCALARLRHPSRERAAPAA